jgi:hypothetical protein
MIAVKHKIAFAVIGLLLANTAFMLYKNHVHESSLESKSNICVLHLQDMVERYESDLDDMQQEIDRRVLLQMKTISRQKFNRSSEESVNSRDIQEVKNQSP